MAKKSRVATNGKPSVAKTLWAYGYEMVPPHTDDRMSEIRRLLDRQNEEAVRAGRTWSARLVARRVIHVLIVSSEVDVEINRKLEAELTELGLQYHFTTPMLVDDETDTLQVE